MIRKATLQDIDSILNITNACANFMIEQGILQWNDSYPARNSFEIDVERKELYVLLEDQIIIGCIVISTLMDAEYIPVNWLTPNKKNLYIHRLAIHPTYQKHGFAQKLMSYAEGLGKEHGMHSIRLDTFSKNERNKIFYEKRGYERLGNIYFHKQSEFPFYCYEMVL